MPFRQAGWNDMTVKTVTQQLFSMFAHRRHCQRPINLLGISFLSFLLLQPAAAAANQRTALKVCADPHSPPFSTRQREGFENQIAMLLAEELALPLEFTWFPQRMGFIRNTLRSERDDGNGYKCDLVMGVPEQFELAITTDPYYRSTYALVVAPKAKSLIDSPAAVDRLAPEVKAKLRIGMTERSPGTLWMAKHDMHEQIAPYIAQSGDPNEYAGEPILKDLLDEKLDAAIIWGPTAGYFKHQHPELTVLPLASEPGIKFDFAISAGVRFGDKEWKNQVDQLLKKNADKINSILEEYEVPLVAD